MTNQLTKTYPSSILAFDLFVGAALMAKGFLESYAKAHVAR